MVARDVLVLFFMSMGDLLEHLSETDKYSKRIQIDTRYQCHTSARKQILVSVTEGQSRQS